MTLPQQGPPFFCLLLHTIVGTLEAQFGWGFAVRAWFILLILAFLAGCASGVTPSASARGDAPPAQQDADDDESLLPAITLGEGNELHLEDGAAAETGDDEFTAMNEGQDTSAEASLSALKALDGKSDLENELYGDIDLSLSLRRSGSYEVMAHKEYVKVLAQSLDGIRMKSLKSNAAGSLMYLTYGERSYFSLLVSYGDIVAFRGDKG